MTQSDIIRMAREAGLWPAVTDSFLKELQEFAALVAATEREACAKFSLKGDDFERAFYRDWEAGKVKRVFEPEPTIDGWPLWSGLPQPEPVAYINVEERKLEWAKPMSWNTPTVVEMDKVPLYTAPPKKEWVGLTLQEIEYIEGMTLDRHDAIRMAAAALQEKNNG